MFWTKPYTHDPLQDTSYSFLAYSNTFKDCVLSFQLGIDLGQGFSNIVH